MPFKDISYLELRQPVCSTEWNHLCNFGRGYHEEPFCKIILNLDQRLWRKCRLSIFLIALAALLFSGAKLFVQFRFRVL